MMSLDENPDRWRTTVDIIKAILPCSPASVKLAIYDYADGHAECARLLAEQSKTFSTKKQVEELVGWPFHRHQESGEGIFLRMREQFHMGNMCFPESKEER